MKPSFLRKKKFWLRFLSIVLALPILLLTIALSILYLKQYDLIQAEIEVLNKGYKGKIEIGETHIKPFANFPYISIKIDDVSVLESKDTTAEKLLSVKDIYTGFNVWDIIQGNFDIKNLMIEDGTLNLVFHKDGTLNIQNALQTNQETSDAAPMDIHLKNIQLRNIDIHKLDEATKVDVETFIYYAKGGFQTAGDLINVHIDTEFELNIVDNGDSTYIKRKHFDFHTDLSLNDKTGKLVLEPSGIRMEHGDFEIQGSIDLEMM